MRINKIVFSLIFLMVTAFIYFKVISNKKEIDKNIFLKKFQVVDARSMKRFQGKMPEPRDGLKSGSIPNSVCLPFAKVINEDNTFKNIKILTSVFTNTLRSKLTTNVVFSCGSGVTASVLALAYSLIHNKYKPKIYDGSWSEYGKI